MRNGGKNESVEFIILFSVDYPHETSLIPLYDQLFCANSTKKIQFLVPGKERKKERKRKGFITEDV